MPIWSRLLDFIYKKFAAYTFILINLFLFFEHLFHSIVGAEHSC